MQEGASTIIMLIIYFHDYIIVFLFLIIGFVSYVFVVVLNSVSLDKYLVDSHSLEVI